MDHELHVACCIHQEEKFVVALSYPRLASKTARSCLKFKATRYNVKKKTTRYSSCHLNEMRISVSYYN